MSTSSRPTFRDTANAFPGRDVRGEYCVGFTLLEVVIGLALTVLIALAAAPLWFTLQSTQTAAGDHALSLLESRVAAARLERDVRLASCRGLGGGTSCPLVEADSQHVVLLTRSAEDGAPELVEWEIADGSLMRRRVPWESPPPSHVSHGLFTDHKTMLECLQADCRFTFLSGGRPLLMDMYGGQVERAEQIRLEGSLRLQAARAGTVHLLAVAEVGR